MGIDLAEPLVILIACEVVSEISIPRNKPRTTCGEQSGILTIIVQGSVIAEEMIIGGCRAVSGRIGEEHIVVVIIVKAQGNVHRHVAHIDVHDTESGLMMSPRGVEVFLAIVVEVDVVIGIGITQA